MFRRGHRRRWAARQPIERSHPAAFQTLRQANDLKSAGAYTQAAQLFEQLGHGAQNRGMINRAPQLYLQAGHCWLLAGNAERSFSLLKQGLGLLASLQQWPALRRAAQVMSAELHRLGYRQATVDLQEWLNKTLPASARPASAPENTPQPRPDLPEKCPYCGAAIRADLVEWIAADTVKCLYCDSAVQAEG
jgi:hypothetical protein